MKGIYSLRIISLKNINLSSNGVKVALSKLKRKKKLSTIKVYDFIFSEIVSWDKVLQKLFSFIIKKYSYNNDMSVNIQNNAFDK